MPLTVPAPMAISGSDGREGPPCKMRRSEITTTSPSRILPSTPADPADTSRAQPVWIWEHAIRVHITLQVSASTPRGAPWTYCVDNANTRQTSCTALVFPYEP